MYDTWSTDTVLQPVQGNGSAKGVPAARSAVRRVVRTLARPLLLLICKVEAIRIFYVEAFEALTVLIGYRHQSACQKFRSDGLRAPWPDNPADAFHHCPGTFRSFFKHSRAP